MNHTKNTSPSPQPFSATSHGQLLSLWCQCVRWFLIPPTPATLTVSETIEVFPAIVHLAETSKDSAFTGFRRAVCLTFAFISAAISISILPILP